MSKRHLLDPIKRVFYDALKGTVVEGTKQGSKVLFSGAAAALTAKIALIGLILGGLYVGKGYLDEFNANSIKETILARLKDRQNEDATKTDFLQASAAKSFDGFYVIKITGKNIYSVRSAEHFYANGTMRKAIPWSNFRHGGISNEPAPLQILGKKYESAAIATRALGQKLTDASVRKPSLAGGKKAYMGGTYVTIDDWGAVDFSVLREMGKM